MTRLLLGLAWLYCIALVALVVLWTLLADRVWWLALTNIFGLFWFAPLLLIVPAAFALRPRGLRAMSALACCLFLLLFGARLLPPPRQTATGAPLRVMTLNLLYTNTHADDLIAAIRAQEADVVAVQELSAHVAAAMQQQLSADYPYQALAPAERDNGYGLLSRYPLHDITYMEGVLAQRAFVDVDGQMVTLFNVHLEAPRVVTYHWHDVPLLRLVTGYDDSERRGELPILLKAIDAAHGPVMVLGDFNTGDREPPYAELAARLHDAYAETSWGFGFTYPVNAQLSRLPAPFPMVRIDYVWSKGPITPTATRVVCASGGSDHCALVANLVLGPDDGARQAQLAESRLMYPFREEVMRLGRR